MPVIDILPHKPYTVAGIASKYAGFTVQNQGTTTLYFSQLQTINPDQNVFDYSVPAGGHINWPQDEPCFVAIKTADLAGRISYASLIADQAGAIGGTVSIAGTVPISVTGTPVVISKSTLSLLATYTVPVSTLAAGGQLMTLTPFNAPLDVSSFDSVLIIINYSSALGIGLSASSGNVYNLQTILANLNDYTIDFNTIVWNPQWSLCESDNNGVPYQGPGLNDSFLIPAPLNNFWLTGSFTKSATANAGTLTITVFGSNQAPPPAPIYRNQGLGLAGAQGFPTDAGLGQPLYLHQGAIGTSTSLIAHVSGPAHVELIPDSGASAGLCDMQTYQAISGVITNIFSQMLVPAGVPQQRELHLPYAPVSVLLSVTAGAGIAFALTQ